MPSDKPLSYSVKEAAKLLGIGRDLAYEGVHRGEIPVVRIGGRLRVPRFRLEQMMGAAPPASSPVEH